MQLKKQSSLSKDKRSASQYDKIFKENIEAVVPSLIINLLHIQVIEAEEIPDDIQHTKERKPDVLKKITDSDGKTFILQIEFQVADEVEMVFRMAEYYIMLRRRYKLPVQQYVLFVGSERPKMVVHMDEESLRFKFPLIVFTDIDYTLFLRSDKPEEVLLAILANFKGQSADNVVRQVVARIEETTQGDFSLKRYFQQLRVLAQLRNLEAQIDKTMDSIADYINEERDILFVRGERKAKVAAERKFISNLLKKMSLSVEQIADIAEVSTDFVLEVKANLAKKK